MIAHFFVDRPVFATVVSVVITLVGGIALLVLPIDQYPYITPPAVKISTSYPGATAITAAESVAAPLEEEINGVPNMIYMRSQSSRTGSVNITVTFDVGSNPDLAAVDVQNSAKQANSVLPADVAQEGVSIEKDASVELLKIALTSDDPKYDDIYLSNYVTINVNGALRRIPGVGRIRNTGARRYAMRIWLRPDRMSAFGLTTTDVLNAVREQNASAAAGQLGAQPGNEDLSLTLPVSTQGRLSSALEFSRIVVRASPDGSLIRLRDIARVELGAQAYRLESKLDGKNAAIIQAYLLPGANALEVADRVKQTLDGLAQQFPQGIDWDVWYDSSTFIKASIYEVMITLIEALLLVMLVVFLFLQRWRATLIPALAVPVSIVGTFAAMAVMGFTVNTVNLLALVLAIGIVVDDAIVVVENVERLMRDEGLSPRDATRKAMSELTGALVATSLVLAAVFVPVSFLSGVNGIMYREFALSITVAVLISTVVALTLSPALCAALLKPDVEPPKWRGFLWINTVLERSGERYTAAVSWVIGKRTPSLLVFGATMIGAMLLFRALPTGFMPGEDQGRFFVDLQLPDGASVTRSRRIAVEAQEIVQAHPAVRHVFSLAGESKRNGSDDSAAYLEVILEDWDIRSRDGYSVKRVMRELEPELNTLIEPLISLFEPPAIAGLGSGAGVDLELQDRSGSNLVGLGEMAVALSNQVEARREVAQMTSSLKPLVPLYLLNVDRSKAKAIGVPLSDIYSTMNVLTGSTRVNDFNLFGRVYRVTAQAEEGYRDRPDSLSYYSVRSNSGSMVPLNVLASLERTTGPAAVVRHNLFSAASISGIPAPGYTTGDVIKAISEEAEKLLPSTMGYEWTGITFQQIRSEGQLGIAMVLACVFAILFLAALYENWSMPVAVLLIAPIAMLGALLASLARGLDNDLFFQIAFIALIGLAAKNSILIVEFAKQLVDEGRSVADAALESARLRFRPIMMTAFSFILGVMPLVLSSGPGSISRQTLSTAILGGMLTATTIGIILVPLFFVVCSRPARSPAPEAQDA
ncbi:MAG: efflux RND transporter permease subunit [Pseudomonadota bacterium]